ncbi:DUF1357 family protein [Borreliella burgdorferi]|uniref:Uncharacterized protein n=2 Tax=Borreliella burgdorferi TaxID=139 RepID=A0A7U3YBS6_BORBG|nr:DUF1357 family protein [Borreliella burgdorferi]ACM10048.1 conserved hypothetical protein [Borreliella burgdorferi 72a]ACN24318.1 conserved hypothetical protein [Borreliella burgdorferi 64b]ACN93137.1 conserved hypothetical protein [Borreliella burgdorferi 118a]ACO38017.1 conserved hypothetical protein [Borreliella burgdorferi Bol26]ACO38440.1 conserved hypothetical protein [Borreliella burgdorferi 29805]
MEKMASGTDKNQEDLKESKSKNNEVLSDSLVREFLEYKNLKSASNNLTVNYSHNDLRESVEINKLANDNLSFEYNTENLLAKGYSFKEVVKGQAEELIRKYVKSAQIFAVAGTYNLEEIDPSSRAILIRLAKTNIDQNKNSENSYKVINFQRIKSDQKNNLRDRNAFFNTYHDLRKAMLNQWEEIKNEFYCNKLA